MGNFNNRIRAIEKINAPQVSKYMCVITEGKTDPEGYKIQPFMVAAGGNGGEPFYLATREDVDKFGARADVDLQIIVIEFVLASERSRAAEVQE